MIDEVMNAWQYLLQDLFPDDKLVSTFFYTQLTGEDGVRKAGKHLKGVAAKSRIVVPINTGLEGEVKDHWVDVFVEPVRHLIRLFDSCKDGRDEVNRKILETLHLPVPPPPPPPPPPTPYLLRCLPHALTASCRPWPEACVCVRARVEGG